MILTQLESLELPWPHSRRSLKRKYKTTKAKAARLMRAKIKKTRTQSLAAIRRQYYLTDAYADFRYAFARNEDIFIASIMLMVTLGFSFAATVSELVLTFLQAAAEMADITGFSMPILLIMVGTVLSVLFGWLLAFVLNMMSIALMEGLNRKVHRSIRSTARKALRYSSRVTGAWFSVIMVVAGPVALGLMAAIAGVYYDLITLGELFDYLPYMAVAAIAWVMVTLIQFSLVPYIALFEPTSTLRETFSRSNQLVRRRGRMFILAGYGALAAMLFVAYQSAAVVQKFLRLDNVLVFAFGIMATLVVANGVMVMLYRKRKLARS